MKKQLIYVPLERHDERYTSHLDRDITKYLEYNKVPFERMYPIQGEKPPTGMFLNPSNTIKNKAHQIKQIAEMYENGIVNDRTVFFFSDLWFPGIESIAYLNHFYNVQPEIRGVLHAGTWTEDDPIQDIGHSGYLLESIIFNMANQIFVGSEYHKKTITKSDGFYSSNTKKIIVTELPLDNKIPHIRKVPKEDIVIFNGRDAKDKQPWLWDELQQRCSKWASDVQFIWTQKEGLIKDDYYHLLARAKVVVSFATQENFGYGVNEAVALGCLPVLPNRVCYPEFYDKKWLYHNMDEAEVMVRHFVRDYDKYVNHVQWPVNNELIFEEWFKGIV